MTVVNAFVTNFRVGRKGYNIFDTVTDDNGFRLEYHNVGVDEVVPVKKEVVDMMVAAFCQDGPTNGFDLEIYSNVLRVFRDDNETVEAVRLDFTIGYHNVFLLYRLDNDEVVFGPNGEDYLSFKEPSVEVGEKIAAKIKDIHEAGKKVAA